METMKFGIIGCGLMAREFVSAAARWCHLPDMTIRPEIISICNRSLNPEKIDWYTSNVPTITQVTDDYREVLANPDVQALYIALPHNLHAETYCAAIETGKILMGEKPFGIDLAANEQINACMAKHPDILVRVFSQFLFMPASQQIGRMIEEKAFGEIISVESGFLHSSDMNPDKAINWKRTIEFNGDYGCMGDLGMHVCAMPFRAGWFPKNVRAVLSNIMTKRPDAKGNTVPCKTWDNATLLCETPDPNTGKTFPMTLKTFRIAPGEKNSWYFKVYGTKASARFSTKQINTLEIMEYHGEPQAWQQIDMGHETTFKSISGGIFEFSFSDAILQTWAAFLTEIENTKPINNFSRCVTPTEVASSHHLFTAALRSHANASTEKLV
jgi:predicted dehydrogenase